MARADDGRHPDVRRHRIPQVESPPATLASSTGDAATDDAIKNDILFGRQLRDAPPEGMPIPIGMRFTAQRPAR